MPYCTSCFMLRDAQEGRYAVPAVNVENMEMALAAMEAAEERRSPIILQTTPTTVAYGGAQAYAALVRRRAEASPVPVSLHLDHGNSLSLLRDAAAAGYSSLMIDGSKLPFEENTDLTRRAVSIARRWGLPLEAELGRLGGKEDAVVLAESSYTDPEMAAAFAERTGLSSLAVSIGTAHGIYKGVPRIDLERLEQIRSRTAVPLVLHGSSGLEGRVVRDCIARGICKVNFATDLRLVYSAAVKRYLREQPDAFDPKSYSSEGWQAVRRRVAEIIDLCGSAGRAPSDP